MTLKDFISQALTQLIESGAQREVEFDLWVIPSSNGIEIATDPRAGNSKIQFKVCIGKKCLKDAVYIGAEYK